MSPETAICGATTAVWSPLTGTAETVLLRTIASRDLVEAWKKEFGIDITPELGGFEEIHLYRCARTGLRFYSPPSIAGSAELYRRLESLEYYYLDQKWEHDVAIAEMRAGERVLDVGCGRGAFVRRMIDRGVRGEGLESNLSAAQAAQAEGLTVHTENLSSYAAGCSEAYDAVCAFQVLEHVPDPRMFLELMVAMLKPGGKLILAVPNHDSFISHATNNLLDGPPHHVTQWARSVLEYLPALLPLEADHFLCEPLAENHVSWYVSVQRHRLRRAGRLGIAAGWLLKSMVRPCLQHSGRLRRRLRGHTLYACFRKVGA